jgi:hypothetical protein
MERDNTDDPRLAFFSFKIQSSAPSPSTVICKKLQQKRLRVGGIKAKVQIDGVLQTDRALGDVGKLPGGEKMILDSKTWDDSSASACSETTKYLVSLTWCTLKDSSYPGRPRGDHIVSQSDNTKSVEKQDILAGLLA